MRARQAALVALLVGCRSGLQTERAEPPEEAPGAASPAAEDTDDAGESADEPAVPRDPYYAPEGPLDALGRPAPVRPTAPPPPTDPATGELR